MEEQTFVCACCGETFPQDQHQEFDGQDVCPDCLETETLLCDCCGNRIWRENNAGDSGTPVCHSCYDHYYTECIRCGATIRCEDARYASDDPDDEEPMCDDCYNRMDHSHAINDYCYKPEPVFHGDGPRYLGVELEIDEGGECSERARELLNIANRKDELIYCKHDGSLDDGFEIVTHPMALIFHQEQMPWQEVMRKAVSMGYTSHKARTCGLHVHVSKDAFGLTEEQQDASIARILYFFEKHWEELLKFSRRIQGQLDRWAARYGYKDQPREILEHAKKGYHGGRYTCVNLTNADTIEFRMFRGTLKYNTLIATLQLVDRVCNVAISLSDDELKELSWTTFVSGCTAPELVQYLKERRLYVNEPVEVGVEV